jgi:hypothetical protein
MVLCLASKTLSKDVDSIELKVPQYSQRPGYPYQPPRYLTASGNVQVSTRNVLIYILERMTASAIMFFCAANRNSAALNPSTSAPLFGRSSGLRHLVSVLKISATCATFVCRSLRDRATTMWPLGLPFTQAVRSSEEANRRLRQSELPVYQDYQSDRRPSISSDFARLSDLEAMSRSCRTLPENARSSSIAKTKWAVGSPGPGPCTPF